jgi:hypothetical protein
MLPCFSVPLRPRLLFRFHSTPVFRLIRVASLPKYVIVAQIVIRNWFSRFPFSLS